MAKQFLIEHRKKIERRFPISSNQLQPGMVVEARYKSRSPRNKSNRQKIYMLLILNPLSIEKGIQVAHAISLNEVIPLKFNKFVKKHGLEYAPKPPAFKNFQIPIVGIGTKHQARSFYKADIKKFLGSANILGTSYRTFNLKFFGVINLVDYKFDQELEDLFEIKNLDETIEEAIEGDNKDKANIVGKYKKGDQTMLKHGPQNTEPE